jgi:acyl dehydratase
MSRGMSRGTTARSRDAATVLPAMPSLAGLYGRAVVTAALRGLGRKPASGDLPATRHGVDGVRVDLQALTRFQQLIGATARDELPSAYVHTVAFPVVMSVLARPDFPLPLLGLVHLSNEVHQSRAIDAFEVLDVVAWAEDLRAHVSGTQVDLVTEVRVQGERVWEGRSVYLARGVSLGAAAPGGPSMPSRRERPAFEAPRPTGVWRLDAGIGRRYAGVSGDWNPIHLNGRAAKVLGMRTTIAHGMYLAARMVEQAIPSADGPLHWRIDFSAPVYLPGTVTVSFARSGPAPSEDSGMGVQCGRRVDVVGWSAKQQRAHFTGWTAEGLPGRRGTARST